MTAEKLVALAALAGLVWWFRRPAPGIATVVTASQWYDPTTGTWKEL